MGGTMTGNSKASNPNNAYSRVFCVMQGVMVRFNKRAYRFQNTSSTPTSCHLQLRNREAKCSRRGNSRNPNPNPSNRNLNPKP